MCECGCIFSGHTYKLKAPGGWYIIQMLSGCDNCSVGPTIHVSGPEAVELYYPDGLSNIPELPFVGEDSEAIAIVKCGLPKDHAVNAAIKTMVGVEAENNVIDEITAEVLVEEFWDEAIREAPNAVFPTKCLGG